MDHEHVGGERSDSVVKLAVCKEREKVRLSSDPWLPAFPEFHDAIQIDRDEKCMQQWTFL